MIIFVKLRDFFDNESFDNAQFLENRVGNPTPSEYTLERKLSIWHEMIRNILLLIEMVQ